jgi:DNA mismatch repair ATPase MutS
MDEIFSSTNVVEGIAGAYAVAKKLSNYDNCRVLISTHFTYLCKLAKDTGKYRNCMMQVDVTGDTIGYPYRMVPGISKQYIALEILKLNGFSDDILDDAMQVRDSLTKKK